MNDIVERLRERLKLRYMGDCKCGHCALVPDDLVRDAADEINRLLAENERLRIPVDETGDYKHPVYAEVERLRTENATLKAAVGNAIERAEQAEAENVKLNAKLDHYL